MVRSVTGASVLGGLRVAVTRSGARDPGDPLVRILGRAGATPLPVPLTRTAPPGDPGVLERAVLHLPGYDWLVVTSARTVVPLVQAIRAAGVRVEDARARGLRICAVGPRTGKVLARAGLAPDVLPERFNAEGVVRSILAEQRGRPPRVLFPRAEEGRETIPRQLRRAGAEVRLVAAYRTLAVPGAGAQLAALVATGEVDALTFTAPSGARLFVEAWTERRGTDLVDGRPDRLGIPAGIGILALGPSTADALRARGLAVDRVAEPYTFTGLLSALAEWVTASG
ncbi:MAG: uroporphyrinogen-III synthase [Gammaproteobacteria bacterium]|nr:uroporphyrinogen-III synthase [Gammaproteobacteria bacterium]MDE0248566.1 uroporphyrinogen-III synthase [Gammaproteobacteria bacterium]